MANAKVYQKSGDRWYVRLWWKGEDYRRFMFDEQVPLKHPALAKIIADSINTDIKRKGKYFDPQQWFSPKAYDLMFDRHAEKWLGTQEHLASYDQIESYFRRWVIPFFGQEDIREIRKGHIKDFLRHIEPHYAPKTCKNILELLAKLFRDALDDELILRSPPFPKVTTPEVELRYLTQEQVYEVISNIPERDQPIFRFGYFYAMRPGEVRALQWDAIHRQRQTVTVKRTFSEKGLQDFTKSKRIRHLPLMTEAMEVLHTVAPGISGFVFRTRYGKPYRKQRLGELWRKAGGPIPLYNGMRHSRAMHLLENEQWDMEYVRALLGHTRSEMTRRYARASAEGLRKRYSAGSVPVKNAEEPH